MIDIWFHYDVVLGDIEGLGFACNEIFATHFVNNSQVCQRRTWGMQQHLHRRRIEKNDVLFKMFIALLTGHERESTPQCANKDMLQLDIPMQDPKRIPKYAFVNAHTTAGCRTHHLDVQRPGHIRRRHHEPSTQQRQPKQSPQPSLSASACSPLLPVPPPLPPLPLPLLSPDSGAMERKKCTLGNDDFECDPQC